jgi:ureidoacrylate peracid hydrolase
MSAFFDNIDPKHTALVFIEFQNEFAAEGGKLNPTVSAVMRENDMLIKSNLVMNEARKKGCKIMHLPISYSEDFKEVSPTAYGILGNVRNGKGFVKGTWGADFVEIMRPAPEDILVSGKSGLCGFESTNLQFLLGQNDIQTVVLAGFLTNVCVESTMRTAYEKGYKVITLTDCTAATSAAEQEAAVKYTYPLFSMPMTQADFLTKLA